MSQKGNTTTKAGYTKAGEFIPECFIDAMCAALPALADESKAVQANLCFLAYSVGSKRRRHKLHTGWSSITHGELNRRLGRTRFKVMNIRLRMFDVRPWNKDLGATRAFRLTPTAQEAKSAYLNRKPWAPGKLRMIGMDGRAKRKVSAAVVSVNRCGVTAKVWRGVKIPSKVPVNLPMLQWLHERLSSRTDDMLSSRDALKQDRRAEIIAQVLRHSRTEAMTRGYMAHTFQEARSGRLIPLGLSLATVPKQVRVAAFHGLPEYDFENCHFRIFEHLAHSAGHACPNISAYVEQRRPTLEALATIICGRSDDFTCGLIKRALIAVLYGSRGSHWKHSKIRQALADKVPLFFSQSLVRGLIHEIDQATPAIIKAFSGPRGAIRNAVGSPFPRNDPDTTQSAILSHILLGAEANMLRIAFQMNPGNLVLPMHDGFVSRHPVSCEAIEAEIRDRTGMTTKLVCDYLQLNADMLHSQTPDPGQNPYFQKRFDPPVTN